MSMITIDQIGRSIKSAVMLQFNGFSPIDDFVQISTLPRDVNGRMMFTYKEQDMVAVHGPNGTMSLPGISIEYGIEISDLPTRYELPIIISLSREVKTSTEREGGILNELGDFLKPLIYNVQSCPVYSFVDDDDYADAIVGRCNWYFCKYGYPEIELIGGANPEGSRLGSLHDSFQGGFLRLEYKFSVFYARNN